MLRQEEVCQVQQWMRGCPAEHPDQTGREQNLVEEEAGQQWPQAALHEQLCEVAHSNNQLSWQY